MDQSYWSVNDVLADSTKIPCHFKLDVPGLAHLQGDPSVSVHSSQASSSSSSSTRTTSNDISHLKRSDSQDPSTIKKGTRVELPYWLAEILVLNDLVDVSLPRPYSQQVRNALHAGAKSVPLRGQGNWWYALGSRLGALMDSEMLMELLSSTYSSRLPSIYTSAQHLASSSSSRSGGGGAGLGDLESGSSRTGSSSNGSSTAGSKSGFGTSVGMSAEMVEFINGLEETEKIALRAAHDSATAMRIYLAGRN